LSELAARTGDKGYTGYLYISGIDSAPLPSELRIVLGRLMRRLRIEHGFPLTQAAVLGRLDRDGSQSISDLAGAERVRPQSMSQTLAELESCGLIARRPDERDGRRTMIELTDEERRVLEQAVPLLARLSEL
jgi:DNA-binding MarR family transcriptional regulator